MRGLRLLIGIWLFVASVTDIAAGAGATASPEGRPLIVPRADQYDLTSRINGLKYRIMVSTPLNGKAGEAYPVVYILDGNWYFLAAAENLAEGVGYLSPAIVVGIGYPTDDRQEIVRRRTLDLTLPGDEKEFASFPTGGGDDFVRVLLEEVKPLVVTHYGVAEHEQILYGKSLGGLIVLHVLFSHPDAFQTYIAASPAIFWDNSSVLVDEESFSKRARAGGLNLRVLITAAANEQYRGNDPKLLAEDGKYRMVDNAFELAARLERLNSRNVSVSHALFADEDHVSVSLAALGRALNFALKGKGE